MLARSQFQAVFFLALSLLVAAPLAAYAQDGPVRLSERLRHRDRLATADLPADRGAWTLLRTSDGWPSYRCRLRLRRPFSTPQRLLLIPEI